MSLNSIEYQCYLNYVRTANWHNLLVSTVAVNEAGDTPLSIECSHGNLEMVKALINKSVDPNSKCLSVLLRCWWWSPQSQSTRLVTLHSLWPVLMATWTQSSTLWTSIIVILEVSIVAHQLLHHSVHPIYIYIYIIYVHRASQQGWSQVHSTLPGLQRWTLGSGQVSLHHSSLWHNK